MKMQVITTITTLLDIDTMETQHSVDINDVDALSEASPDVLGALLLGALGATKNAVMQQFPVAARADARLSAKDNADAVD